MSLHLITDLGDQAVILPLVLATGLVLLLAGWWRGALAWYMEIVMGGVSGKGWLAPVWRAAILATPAVAGGAGVMLGTLSYPQP